MSWCADVCELGLESASDVAGADWQLVATRPSRATGIGLAATINTCKIRTVITPRPDDGLASANGPVVADADEIPSIVLDLEFDHEI
jgi:hypothetical protein